MADYEDEETQGFKVSDKRRFSSEGEMNQDQDSGDIHGVKEPDKPDDSFKEEPRKKQRAAPLTDVNFSTLIASLAQSALFQLGLMRTQDMNEPIEPDLEGAKQTINLIAILEQKTKGNLTEQEKKLIDDTLFQLRMAFVEVSK